MATQPTDGQRHRAQLAALYAEQPRARLINIRPMDSAVLVTIAQPDGTAQVLRVSKADDQALSVLPENERSKVRHAVHSMHLKRAQEFLTRCDSGEALQVAGLLQDLGEALAFSGSSLAVNMTPDGVARALQGVRTYAKAAELMERALLNMLPEGFEPPPEDFGDGE